MKHRLLMCIPLALGAFALQASERTEQVDSSSVNVIDPTSDLGMPQGTLHSQGTLESEGSLEVPDTLESGGSLEVPDTLESGGSLGTQGTLESEGALNSRGTLETQDTLESQGALDSPRTLGQDAVTPMPANNSGINKRDRDSGSMTADDQSQSSVDVALVAKVRRAVMDQDGLSVDGQNIKIITTENGITLRGPVKSMEERTAIEAAVRTAAGTTTVESQLEVR